MVEVVLTGNEITLQQIINVARQGAKVSLSPLAEKNIIRSRRVVDKLVDESRVVYGVTTGGSSAKRLSKKSLPTVCRKI